MPQHIEGVGTVYTEAEVNAGFLSKDRHNEVLAERLGAKTKQIDTLKGQVLELNASLQEASTASASLEKLQAELAAERDAAAFRRAGLDPESKDLDLIRWAHEKHVAELPDDQKPGDLAAHFREWIAADEGAKTHRYTSHLFKAPADAAPAAAPPPAAPPVAPPAAPPPPVTTTGAPDPQPGRRWTAAAIKSAADAIKMGAGSTAEKQAQLAALMGEVQKAG